ncbi:unnamed protein product [Mytilus coruscus]|uniref:Reverse transcriptase domain-containing protein n=1 Tax=Mytilus coruscus TaxID=42192 RepID=A0A6J8DBL8_MYTCO|nr:unnamed protein product [Mytilus coruscus]
MNVKRCTLLPTKIYTRPNWKKCDKSVYKSTIENSLGKTSGQNNKPNNVESRIQKLESALHMTGKKSIPNYRKLKTLKSVGKEAVDDVSVETASIINNIFTNLDVPKSFKNGILKPVLKKKKNKTIPGNYRGIVVTSIFSKIFESIVKGRLEYELLPSQNPLQRGFTEGASSLFAAFITTETILLYRLLQILLELVALDVEKAFDPLSHEIMLNKLFHDEIEGDMWILLRNIYQDLSLKVKWNNETSESINILQEAEFKCELVTGTYMLQSTRAKFSKNTIHPNCKLCNESEETLEHFLLHCFSLTDVRQRYLDELFEMLREIERGGTTNVINNELLLKNIY